MASKNSIAAERDVTGRNLPHRSSVRIYSRYGSVKESAGTLMVTFEFPEELTLGLAHRAREARRRVLKWLRRVDPLTIEKGDGHLNATFSCHVAGALTSALNAIDRDLQALMRERLHPALVEELLGIRVGSVSAGLRMGGYHRLVAVLFRAARTLSATRFTVPARFSSSRTHPMSSGNGAPQMRRRFTAN
jgi:hypothetical protein